MRLIILFSILFACGLAQAATTYSYIGNTYTDIGSRNDYNYDTSMAVHIEFTIDGPFAVPANGDIKSLVTSYSFSDGVQSFHSSDASGTGWARQKFDVWFDEDGNIEDWQIYFKKTWSLGTVDPEHFEISSSSIPGLGQFDGIKDQGIRYECIDYYYNDHQEDYVCDDDLFDEGYVANMPGLWTKTVVPIPAAVWLFGSALAGLGWMRRKQTA